MLNSSRFNANSSVLEAEFFVPQEPLKTGVNDNVPADYERDTEFEFSLDPLDETASPSLPLTALVLTSLTSLIATCGVGLLISSKASGPNDIVYQPAPVAPAVASDRQEQPTVNTQQQAPSPPEPTAHGVTFSSRQETQALVQNALAEYNALLDRSSSALPPAARSIARSSAPVSMSAPTLPIPEAAGKAPAALPATEHTALEMPASVYSSFSLASDSVQGSISKPQLLEEWHTDRSIESKREELNLEAAAQLKFMEQPVIPQLGEILVVDRVIYQPEFSQKRN